MKFHYSLHTILRAVRDPGLFLRSVRDPGFFLRTDRDPGLFLTPAKRPADEDGEIDPEYEESLYQRAERNPGREYFIFWI